MEEIRQLASSKSKLFLIFCGCFLVGDGMASVVELGSENFNSLFLLPLIISSVSLFFILKKKIVFRLILISLMSFIFGVLRFVSAEVNCSQPQQLCFFNGAPATLTGWISAEPDPRLAEARYTITVTSLATPGANFSVTGKVLVRNRLFPEYHYADPVKFNCFLEAPGVKAGSSFRYDRFLERQGITSQCSRLSFFEMVPTGAAGPEDSTALTSILTAFSSQRYMARYIFSFKQMAIKQIKQLWTTPASGLMMGVLLGSKSGLPTDLLKNLNRAGLTHLITVSGFKLTLVSLVLMAVLVRLGLWRQQAWLLVVMVIVIIVIGTGFSAATVRGAVFTITTLLAQQVGRLRRPINALLAAGAAMVLVNPYLLVFDIGFQLSFTAALGIIYLWPSLDGWWKQSDFINSSQHRFFLGTRTAIIAWLRAPLLITLSIIIAISPILLFQFGQLSLVAIPANVLLLWIVPWLMLGGSIAIVASFIFFPLGQLLALLVQAGLSYTVFMAELLGAPAWAVIDFQLPWWGALAAYPAIFIFINKMNEILQLRKNE